MEPLRKIVTCFSETEILKNENEITEKIKLFKNAKAVVWYFDKIQFYKIDTYLWNSSLRDFNEIVRLRLFDSEKELHLWRSNSVLQGRFRIDGKGESIEYIETRPYLNGTTFNQTFYGIIVTEDKGINYELPYVELNDLIGTKNRIALVTRNYIGYSEIRQAGIIDFRFVDFEIVDFKKK